jgi:hypothetical protein
MPPIANPSIDSAILRRASEITGAARYAVAHAEGELGGMAPATAGYSNGYKLVYVATNGCGERHDYSKLLGVAQRSGATLAYINIFNPGLAFQENIPGVGIKRAVGTSLPFYSSWGSTASDNAQRYTVATGLYPVYAPKILLLGPGPQHGTPLATYDSNDPRLEALVRARIGAEQRSHAR